MTGVTAGAVTGFGDDASGFACAPASGAADALVPGLALLLLARLVLARGAHQPTEVTMLDAEVLEVVREGNQYVASVRFHGALREDGARDAHPFEELWHLVKPVDGSSGWLLAGIQQTAPALA